MRRNILRGLSLASYQDTAGDGREAADAPRGQMRNVANPVRSATVQDCKPYGARIYIGQSARFMYLAAALMVLLIVPPATASEPPLAQIDPRCDSKAACIHNIIYFVEWPQPEAAKTSLTLGIVGTDPIRDNFASLEGRSVGNGMTLEVITFDEYTTDTDFAVCDVLFVCRSESLHLEAIVESLWGEPVLTIGDWPDFIRAGGMIEIVQVNAKMRWRVNLRPVKESGLHLSSQLLRNALEVICVPGDEKCPGNGNNDAGSGARRGREPGP